MECLLGVAVLVALFVAAGVAWQGFSDRRKIRSALAYRDGRLVKVAPWWTHRRVVNGWRHGRLVRFQWLDPDDRLRNGRCEIMERFLFFRGGTFRFLNDPVAESHELPADVSA